MQYHTVRVSVNIKNVHLLVRFPCRLSFQLKTENGLIETTNTYELIKGQCEVNQTIYIDFDVEFQSQRRIYNDKNIKLVVMMSSANGIIPAGSVFFNPCLGQNLQRNELQLVLQKCPDRTATIKFVQWFEYLRTIHNANIHQSSYLDTRYNVKGNRSQMKHSTYTSINQDNFNIASNGRTSKMSPLKKGVQMSPNYKLKMINSNNSPVVSSLTPRSNRLRTYNSNYECNDFGQAVHQTHQSIMQSQLNPRYQSNTFIEQNRYEKQYPMNHSAFVRNSIQQANNPQILNNAHNNTQIQNNGQIQNNRQKMEFTQKAQYLKQIAKLRGQVKSLQNQDKWEQLIRVKDQNQQLLMDLQKQKEKYRFLQRKDRQYNVQIKQLKDQLERFKVKITNVQCTKLQIQLNLTEKDRKLKQALTEIKQLQEKLSESNLTITTSQKRIEFKESSFQEQLSKMTQKYNQSQDQRQKITSEYNNLLSKMQQTQKKYQLNSKQKERFFNDEKNKLNKKVQVLNQKLDKVNDQLKEKQSSLSETTTLYKSLSIKDKQKQARLCALQSEIEYSNIAHKTSQQRVKNLQSQVQRLLIVQKQHNTLKKKHTQSQTQCSRLRQRLQRSQVDHSNLSSKLKDQSVSLQEVRKQKSSLQSRLNILTKEYEQLNRVHEKKMREQELLSAENMNSTQRVNDLRSKLQTEHRDFNEVVTHYEEQLGYITKAKQYADADVEDLKWQITRQKDQYEQLTSKLKQSTGQVLNLNKQLLQSLDINKRLQQQLSDESTLSKNLSSKITSLQQKERKSQQSIKSKTNQNYQLSKCKLSLEQQVYHLNEKLVHSQNVLRQKQSSYQKQIKQIQQQIYSLQQENAKCNLTIINLNENVSDLSQQRNIRNNQIINLKEKIVNNNDKIKQIQTKNDHLREELKNSQFLNDRIASQKAQLNLNIIQLNKNLQKVNKDSSQYKSNTTAALQQLITQISKDEDQLNSTKTLMIFPDMTLSSMQVQAVKKRNIIILSYRQKISDLTKSLQLQKMNNQKLKYKSQQRQKQLQNLILRQKQKIKAISTQNQSLHDKQSTQIRQLQQEQINLRSSIQKYINQLKRSQQLLAQSHQQYQQLLVDRQQQKHQIKSLEQTILNLRSTQIKSKSLTQIKFIEFNKNSDHQIMKVKSQLVENQRKLKLNQRIVTQKQQSIKKLENSLSLVTYQRDKLQQKTIQLNQKLSQLADEKKLLQKKLKTIQKQSKQQIQLLNQAQESITNQKSKFEQIKLKYNNTFEQLTDCQVLLQRQKQQLQVSLSIIKSLKQQKKQASQKAKLLSQKQSSQHRALREQIITLSSQASLKQFIISQHESNLKELKQQILNLKEDLTHKKEQLLKVNQQLDIKNTQAMHVDQSLVMAKGQKLHFVQENQRYRNRILSLEDELTNNRIIKQAVDMKDKQLTKLRQQVQSSKKFYEKNLTEMRTSTNLNIPSQRTINRVSTSRLNLQSPRSVDEQSKKKVIQLQQLQQSKRKITQLQQLLSEKHPDFSTQRSKIISECQYQKKILLDQISQLNQKIQNMQNEFQFQRTQLKRQLQSSIQDNTQLYKVIQQKQQVIYIIESHIKDMENGNISRVPQLKSNIQQLKKSIQSRLKQNSFSIQRYSQRNAVNMMSKIQTQVPQGYPSLSYHSMSGSIHEYSNNQNQHYLTSILHPMQAQPRYIDQSKQVYQDLQSQYTVNSNNFQTIEEVL